MLSLLIVIFCAFITINGFDTCEKEEKEDWVCTTPCGGGCSGFHRAVKGPVIGSRRSDDSCTKGQRVQDCKSVLETLKIDSDSDQYVCRDLDYWIDKVWNGASDEEKASGELTGSQDSALKAFALQWSHKCRVQEDYEIDDADERASAIKLIKEHTLDACGRYQKRTDYALGGTIDRNYLFVTDSRDGHDPNEDRMVVKYCDRRGHVGPAATEEERRDRAEYENQILTGFKKKAQEIITAKGLKAKVRSGASGRGAAPKVRPAPPKRSKSKTSGSGRKIPKAPERKKPKPPPRKTGKSKKAHEEYVDNLWQEVNQMEEDELRYERALDKLRRATQLREMHKKRLRRYYN